MGVARPRLTVDLGAIVANWRGLAELAPGAECASVVKADAYCLGMDHVATALLAGGGAHVFCRDAGGGAAPSRGPRSRSPSCM